MNLDLNALEIACWRAERPGPLARYRGDDRDDLSQRLVEITTGELRELIRLARGGMELEAFDAKQQADLLAECELAARTPNRLIEEVPMVPAPPAPHVFVPRHPLPAPPEMAIASACWKCGLPGIAGDRGVCPGCGAETTDGRDG